jgi:multidrug efflux system membrane fusion protein
MKGTHQRKSAVTFALAATTVAVIALLVATGCGKKQEETPKEIVRPVKVFTLGQAAGRRTMDLPGETRAIRQAVLAFEVSGRISELLVKEGDVVKDGQVLARLDPRDLKAKLDAATARRDAAKPKMERADILAQKSAVSKQYFEEAKREYEVAVADLAQAQKALEDTMLKADFDGVVAKVLLKRFENVAAKQEVLVLQDTSEIEVAVNIPESLVATSRPNRTLEEITERAKPEIELTAVPGRRFPARITEASQRADPATRTYEAKVVFAPPHDLTILPGMTAKVIAQVQPDAAGAAGAFRVPSNAIASEPDGKPFVWRLDPKTMTVSKVPVTTGQASGSMVEISGELAAGDEIVISGVPQLRAGTKVSRWQGTDSGRP